jgi:hypothetical protein
MTFSPLTNGTAPHHNKFAARNGRRVSRIIVHHWAGVVGGDSRLVNPSQEVSANYILYSDGTLVGQVPEEYRAWTSGSWEVDSTSITVEVQNSGVGGDWPVSDAAIAKLTQLIADLGRRYGWGSISWGAQVRGHREFVATACPGPYLWSRLPQISADANAQLGGAAPAPVAGGGSVSGDVDALARAVIAGQYGNGPARRAALGARYNEVQARVNQILSGGAPAAPVAAPAAPAAPSGDVDALAQAVIRGDYGNGPTRQARLGARYAEVQARVNAILAGGSAPAPAPAAPAVDIEGLAQAVIRGEYGNGDARRAALGANYDAVQGRVNAILAGQTPVAVDIEGLARAVIRGDYGNGDARRAALGANYDAVQARVNQILG